MRPNFHDGIPSLKMEATLFSFELCELENKKYSSGVLSVVNMPSPTGTSKFILLSVVKFQVGQGTPKFILLSVVKFQVGQGTPKFILLSVVKF